MTSIKNLANITKELGHGINMATILKEFEWQQKDTPNFKETAINQTSPMVLVIVNEGSPFIQIGHLVGKFGRDMFNPPKTRIRSQVSWGIVFRD